MKKIILIIMFMALLALTSCTSLRSPYGNTRVSSELTGISRNISKTGLVASYYETGKYPVNGKPFAVEFVPAGNYEELLFDGEYIYFPYYILQRYSRKSTEPEHTIIGEHLIGISLLNGEVSHGSYISSMFASRRTKNILTDFYILPFLSGYPPISAARNERFRISNSTSIFSNQSVYYHPGMNILPASPGLLPQEQGINASESTKVRILKNETGAVSTIELFGEEYNFYLGFTFDSSEYKAELLVLSYSSRDALLSNLESYDGKDAEGYDLVTGLNAAGFDVYGNNPDGSSFSGKIDPNGPQGRGILTDAQGNTYDGNFVDGLADGFVIAELEDGVMEFAEYRMGEIVSPVYTYNPSTDQTSVTGVQGNRTIYVSDPGMPGDLIFLKGFEDVSGVSPDGKVQLYDLDTGSREPFMRFVDESGSIYAGNYIGERSYVGRIDFTDGSVYTGEFSIQGPNGPGRFETGEGDVYSAVFSPTDDPLVLNQVSYELSIALELPVAREVAVSLTGNKGDAVDLDGKDGFWDGFIEVLPGDRLDITVFVNGVEITDSELSRILSEFESLDELLNNPIVTDSHMIAVESYKSLIRRENPLKSSAFENIEAEIRDELYAQSMSYIETQFNREQRRRLQNRENFTEFASAAGSAVLDTLEFVYENRDEIADTVVDSYETYYRLSNVDPEQIAEEYAREPTLQGSASPAKDSGTGESSGITTGPDSNVGDAETNSIAAAGDESTSGNSGFTTAQASGLEKNDNTNENQGFSKEVIIKIERQAYTEDTERVGVVPNLGRILEMRTEIEYSEIFDYVVSYHFDFRSLTDEEYEVELLSAETRHAEPGSINDDIVYARPGSSWSMGGFRFSSNDMNNSVSVVVDYLTLRVTSR